MSHHFIKQDKLSDTLTREIMMALHKKNGYYIIFKFLSIISIWICFSFVVLQSEYILIKCVLWFFLGFFLNGIVQLAHDSWHYNLFEKKWQNKLFGNFLSLIFPILYSSARHEHMLHHRYNGTEKDPNYPLIGDQSLKTVLITYIIVFLGLPLGILYFNFLHPINSYPKTEIKKHVGELLILASCHALIWYIIIKLNYIDLALQVWIIPFMFTSFWNGLKSISDHYQNEWSKNKYRTAATVRSNKFIEFWWNGLNYHLDHHLFANIPGYNLPKLHAHIRPFLISKTALIFDSYLHIWFNILFKGASFTRQAQESSPNVIINAKKVNDETKVLSKDPL